jgi:hypothetical protein
MRNGQNKQRMRNRNNNNNNRRGQNPMTRVFESNGPDIKIRGTASHIAQPRNDELMSEEGDEDGESFSNFGQEPGFVPAQPQPYLRDSGPREQPRDNQPYHQRDQQPRDHRDREPRPQYQHQPQPQPQPQPAASDNGSVDRLPSFITGAQPQINGGGGGGGYEGGGERYPRRRRRPHGPRPDSGMAQPAAPAGGDDFNSGNE